MRGQNEVNPELLLANRASKIGLYCPHWISHVSPVVKFSWSHCRPLIDQAYSVNTLKARLIGQLWMDNLFA